jgi:NADH-quinone oxidoreductase subunit N
VQNPAPGGSAVLYYLTGYLFTVLGAFTVICIAMRRADAEDISALAGLNQRSPLLAAVMTLAMVSLAGIPPLAGFFGKFLLLKAALEHGAANHGFYCLAGVAIVGVVISLYYYFGVVRAIYWSDAPAEVAGIPIPVVQRLVLYVCVAGMLYLGLFPNRLVNAAVRTAATRPVSALTAIPTPP